MSHTVMISPCGTSTLTNQADGEIRELLNKTADSQEQDLTPEQQLILEQYIDQRRSEILQASIAKVCKWSAELNGILSYYQNQIPPKTDIHFLLATATYQGQKTAGIIQSWLEQHGCCVQIVRTADESLSKYLNVNNLENFRIAMSELVKWAEETLPGYRKSNYRIIFNLTGGFKSVNSFLQAIGMFYADECVYIFQGSQELLRIPRLPVKLDPEGIIRENLTIFRHLAQGETLPLAMCRAIPETLLYQIGDEVEMSAWGELLWNRCKDDYYSEQLLEPLSKKIRYSETFKKTFASLSPERKKIVNERLDQLSRCLESLETNQIYNPKSLDFKALKKNPCPPSTHECDAWSDLDAKRIFGHFEDGIFVIDKLDKGLHG